jgi:N-acetylneuraminic acid mutarotase
VSIGTTVSWASATGAASYDVYFVPNAFGTGTFIGNQAGTAYNPGTLTYNTTYYWRIDSKNTAGTTTGIVWSFTTNSAPTPPAPATAPNPTNGAPDISITQQLTWASAIGATSYDVYFVPNAFGTGTFIGNQAGTSYDPGTLSYSATYYWRIDSKNSAGTTTGTVWGFTTGVEPVTPPDPATSPSPSNGATSVSITTAVSWASALRSTSYDVYFGTTNPPDYKTNTTSTTYTPSTLSYSATYYWRIDSKNEANPPTTTGIVWSFQTEADSHEKWTTKAPMPTARDGLACGVVNNKIYVIGGMSRVGSTDIIFAVNEEYDPAANTWATKTSMPTARASLGVAVVNNKIYAIGGNYEPSGQSGPWASRSTNEEYDPVSNTWTTKTPMPTSKGSFAIAVVNNKIYCIGGYDYNGGGNVATNYEYNPATDSWATKAPLPVAGYSFGVGVVNNKIYCIGGYSTSSGLLSLNAEYDPATNSWANKAAPPTVRGAAGVTLNNKIYWIGSSSDVYVAITEEYNPATNSWATKLPMPTARFDQALGAVNGKIYAIGGSIGSYGSGPYTVNEEYQP